MQVLRNCFILSSHSQYRSIADLIAAITLVILILTALIYLGLIWGIIVNLLRPAEYGFFRQNRRERGKPAGRVSFALHYGYFLFDPVYRGALVERHHLREWPYFIAFDKGGALCILLTFAIFLVLFKAFGLPFVILGAFF